METIWFCYFCLGWLRSGPWQCVCEGHARARRVILARGQVWGRALPLVV